MEVNSIVRQINASQCYFDHTEKLLQSFIDYWKHKNRLVKSKNKFIVMK